MKTACTFILLVILPSILTAQINDSLKLRHHEIGINLTSLINEIIPGDESQIQLSPYLVTYYFTGRHHAFRFGFGVFSNSRIDNDTLIILSNSSFSLDLRGGYEYRVSLTKRWSAAFGLDVLYGRDNSHFKTSTNLDQVTIGNKGWTIGGGPVITVRFDVNNRIRLSTECTLYHSYTESTNYQHFLDFPEFNVDQTSIFNGFKITVPINIYFNIRL